MRDRPADSAAVADLEVADPRRGLGEQRHGRRNLGARFDGGIHGGCTDDNRAVVALNAPQIRDPPHVDEVLEDGQAEGKHRDQALASGEHLRVVAEVGQERHRLVGSRGGVVLERSGLQGDRR